MDGIGKVIGRGKMGKSKELQLRGQFFLSQTEKSKVQEADKTEREKRKRYRKR